MNYAAIINEANEAAGLAAQIWLEKAKPKYEVVEEFPVKGRSYGTLLDVCGNAWLTPKDKRNAHYKAMKRLGYIKHDSWRPTHALANRQEKGLNEASAMAALQVFERHGISCFTVYSYVD